MFLEFYGLKAQPFGVTPDPKYLFWSAVHREAVASLFYGIEAERGFMTLIAPPGTGKTTLLFHLLERLRGVARTAFLFQTDCSPRELLGCLMADLGCYCGEDDTVTMNSRLNEILLAEAAAGRRFVLIIDEAQNLDKSALETLRLLSDFETPNRKLMQIVLAGQPQLAANLSRPESCQLRQRISIMSRLKPLTSPEIGEYIEHRLKIAGYEGPRLFAHEAIALVESASKGIPRSVNNICFGALTIGYARNRKTIDAAIMREAIADLDLDFSQPYAVAKVRIGVSMAGIAASLALLFLFGTLMFSFFAEKTKQRPIAAAASAPISAKPQSAETRKKQGLSGYEPPAYVESPQIIQVTVERNDTLSLITRRYLGRELDEKLGHEILELNPAISDPNLIRTGEPLRLPVSLTESYNGPEEHRNTNTAVSLSPLPEKEAPAIRASP